MKRWQIAYADGARSDILAITGYIARDSQINADKVLARIEKTIQSLRTMPGRGRIVPELRWHGIMAVHEIIERPWRIMYRILPDTVLIIAVYDGRRQAIDVILERAANS